jgi:antitoxin HicB
MFRRELKLMKFKVIFEWNDDGGGYTATVPGLPGCISEGDTLEEAVTNTEEAIIGYIEALKIQGRPLPDKDPRMFFGEVEVAL